MARVVWNWKSRNSYIHGFKYLWLKTVNAFDDSQHCARCFKGSYSKAFGTRMAVNQNIEAEYHEGQLLYFCGVSMPYRWPNNFHLAGRVKEGAVATLHDLYTGDTLTVLNLEVIPIDASIAEARYPDRGADFLTCRNFQFGAQMFDVGGITRPVVSEPA